MDNKELVKKVKLFISGGNKIIEKCFTVDLVSIPTNGQITLQLALKSSDNRDENQILLLQLRNLTELFDTKEKMIDAFFANSETDKDVADAWISLIARATNALGQQVKEKLKNQVETVVNKEEKEDATGTDNNSKADNKSNN